MSVFAVEYVYDAESAELREQHRPEHRAWLKSLLDEGRVLASGPFTDGSGALLIFTAPGEDELHDLLRQDPFASAGVISGLKATEWKPLVGPFSTAG